MYEQNLTLASDFARNTSEELSIQCRSRTGGRQCLRCIHPSTGLLSFPTNKIRGRRPISMCEQRQRSPRRTLVGLLARMQCSKYAALTVGCMNAAVKYGTLCPHRRFYACLCVCVACKVCWIGAKKHLLTIWCTEVNWQLCRSSPGPRQTAGVS